MDLPNTHSHDPPAPPSTLPSYLSHLSPHTWYDYNQSPATVLVPTPSKPKSRPKPPITLRPADILILADLLPSTRPLLSTAKFLKALNLSPEETAELTKNLKELTSTTTATTTTTTASTGRVKPKSKLEQLRERELQLAREEAKQEAQEEKRKEARRKKELDQALGLVGKTGRELREEKRKEARRKREIDQALGLVGTVGSKSSDYCGKVTASYEAQQGDDKLAEQRKKRRVEDLDRQLGLIPATGNLLDTGEEGGGDTKADTETSDALSTRIDVGDAAAIRRAAIDVLLGLVGSNEPSPGGSGARPEAVDDLRSETELTRIRIDKEMVLLNSTRMAQMDAILGLLSPPRTVRGIRD